MPADPEPGTLESTLWDDGGEAARAGAPGGPGDSRELGALAEPEDPVALTPPGRWGLRERIVAIVAVAVAGLVLLGAGSLWSGQQNRARLGEVTQLREAASLATTIRVLGEEVHAGQRAYAWDTRRLDARVAVSHATPHRAQYLTAADALRAQLSAMPTGALTDAERAQVDQVRGAWARFFAADDRAVALYRQGTPAAMSDADEVLLASEKADYRAAATLVPELIASLNARAGAIDMGARWLVDLVATVQFIVLVALVAVLGWATARTLRRLEPRPGEPTVSLASLLPSSAAEPAVEPAAEPADETADETAEELADEPVPDRSVSPRTAGAVRTPEPERPADDSDAAEPLGHVADAICAIAERTNLLALDATIEAARADEAGSRSAAARGVRDLARETATAARDIGAQVAAVRADTAAAVAVMSEISDVVARINDTQATVASAVAAHGGHASRASRRARGAPGPGAAGESGSVRDLVDSAGDLADEAVRLRGLVDGLRP